MKTNDAEIVTLRRFSASLGRNPLLVQASTGNTSLKTGEALWVKASGTWLQNAEGDDIFVAVPLSHAQDALTQQCEITSLYPSACGKALRASVETAMHAILPYRVVAHVHSVNTIAWAVREDAPYELSRLLDGLSWEWITYAPSGWRLAKEIQRALARSPDANVFVLGNHGLVVCGDTCEDVYKLLMEVERRVFVQPRSGSEPDWTALQARTKNSRWRLPQSRTVHALATDRCTRDIASRGVLYPCQAIFFEEMPHAFSLPEKRLGANAAFPGKKTQPFVILDEAGVLFSENITNAEREVLIGFAEVVQRVHTNAPLRYLTDAESQQVSSGDVHHYRRLAFA